MNFTIFFQNSTFSTKREGFIMPNCSGYDLTLTTHPSDPNDPNSPVVKRDDSINIYNSSGPYWWLSDDIKLFHLDSNNNEITDGTAILGSDNYLDVRVHKTDQLLLPDTFEILVELWLCNPFLSMDPRIVTDTRFLFRGSIQATALAPNLWLSSVLPLNGTVTPRDYPSGAGLPSGKVNVSIAAGKIKWIPDPNDPVQWNPDPNNLNHKCLIARVYQDALSDPKPDNECFHAGQDTTGKQLDLHVAQRNLDIVKVSPSNTSVSFPIKTVGLNPEVAEKATIRVVADRTPSPALLRAITPSLERFPGYKRIAPASVLSNRFALKIPERLSPVIRDYTRIDRPRPDIPSLPPLRLRELAQYIYKEPEDRFMRFKDAIFAPEVIVQDRLLAKGFGLPTVVELATARIPTYEADVQLPPKEAVQITLTVDLPASSQVGDAHVFHVVQVNTNQQVVGGITVVAVVVNPGALEAANALTNKRGELVRRAYQDIFGTSSGRSQREYAACLRDLGYYLTPIIQCCQQSSTQPLDSFISQIKELNQSLGYPASWFVAFYRSVKANHGLTGDAAAVANSYLDYAINAAA
ncbi:hypothetical protein ACN4EK_06030 [Pantanalinema rosaneae CENA516]|uniref:hypothetical protein n=1 Tax=Pantanalinema rosaneae TaxID=1620701 RepID=UPI003D6E6965